MTPVGTLPIIDTDSHITEPPDLWTSRMSKKHLDIAPRIVSDPENGRPRWQIGSHLTVFALKANHGGWKEFHPGYPPSFAEADPAGWEPRARLQRLDDLGIYAQVLYPNILGFCAFAFMEFDRDAATDCVRAYNDFQAEFASADPSRLIPIMFLPFWDVDASIKEMDRCVALGFKGINFGMKPQKLGFPPLKSEHWTPLLSHAQDLDLSVNFHVGFTMRTKEEFEERREGSRDELSFSQGTAMLFLSNADGIAECIMQGICHRFPKLKFISVESGYGYVPYLLEALDWQFINSNMRKEMPDWLLPSEYFRRQMYVMFWFETLAGRQIDLYPDNVMFESDFPHPTSLSPGEGSFALSPAETVKANLADFDEATLRKVLYETAMKVYKLPPPPGVA